MYQLPTTFMIILNQKKALGDKDAIEKLKTSLQKIFVKWQHLFWGKDLAVLYTPVFS